MIDRPLVSVITPTWQRATLLRGCIENVRAQTYRPLEHVIVSDGPDYGLTDRIKTLQIKEMEAGLFRGEHGTEPAPSGVLVRFVPLGRNWSSYLVDSFCAAPVTVGMLLAAGAYQTWLADDERMEPDHIESLVDALEAIGADFAYSRCALTWPSGRSAVIGTDPPQLGQITNVLYRADLLKRGLYPFGAGMTSDWACIRRWMEAGATWAYTGRMTLTHRVDH